VNFLRLTAIYSAAVVPYFFNRDSVFTGLRSARANGLQSCTGADLAGGATACLAVVPLLNILGGPNAIVCAALAMAMGGRDLGWHWRERRLPLAFTALLVGLVAAKSFTKTYRYRLREGKSQRTPMGGVSRAGTRSRGLK